MLDKTIPYKDIIMKAPKAIAAYQPITSLPEGYTYHMFQDGDDVAWAKLETAVGEFDNYEDALRYFHRVFMPYKDTLKDRMCFIMDQNEELVSTSTAWYKEDETCRYALLHWVSTSPSQQRKGLASAIVRYALSKFIEVEPTCDDIFLHTQTWSYKAIALYYKCGFRISATPLLKQTTDMTCIPILAEKLTNEIMRDIVGE